MTGTGAGEKGQGRAGQQAFLSLPSPGARRIILGVMLGGTSLAVLDSSILNISVLTILREFRADMATLEWVLTSYNLVFAMFLIGLGRLGDLAGRRWSGRPRRRWSEPGSGWPLASTRR